MESPNTNQTTDSPVSNTTPPPIDKNTTTPTSKNLSHKAKLTIAAIITSLILLIILGAYLRTFLSSVVRIESPIAPQNQENSKVDESATPRPTIVNEVNNAIVMTPIELKNIKLQRPIEDRSEKIFKEDLHQV